MAKHGARVRSRCRGEPVLTVGLRSLLRAGRNASPTLFVFWPILVLLTIPGSTVLYWEKGMPSYDDGETCVARLPELEAKARVDEGFLNFVREINHGELPVLSFSRECTDMDPKEFYYELLKKDGPGEKT